MARPAHAIQVAAYGYPGFFAAPAPLAGAWGFGGGAELGLPLGLTVGGHYLTRAATYLGQSASSKQVQVPLFFKIRVSHSFVTLGAFTEMLTTEPLNYGVFAGIRTPFGRFFQETRFNYGLPLYKSKDFMFMFGVTFGNQKK